MIDILEKQKNIELHEATSFGDQTIRGVYHKGRYEILEEIIEFIKALEHE